MRNVLIAVGDATFKKTLQLHLKQSCLYPKFFECANDAIHFTLESQPKLVLANYRLPDIDGISFLSRIRRLSPKSFLVLFGSKALVQPVLQSVSSIHACISSKSELIALLHTVEQTLPALQQRQTHVMLQTTGLGTVPIVLDDLSLSATPPVN